METFTKDLWVYHSLKPAYPQISYEHKHKIMYAKLNTASVAYNARTYFSNIPLTNESWSPAYT